MHFHSRFQTCLLVACYLPSFLRFCILYLSSSPNYYLCPNDTSLFPYACTLLALFLIALDSALWRIMFSYSLSPIYLLVKVIPLVLAYRKNMQNQLAAVIRKWVCSKYSQQKEAVLRHIGLNWQGHLLEILQKFLMNTLSHK